MRARRKLDSLWLWHYTDASGLLGIVSSGKFRFGDVHFLNDATERSYGADLLSQMLADVINAEGKDGLATEIAQFLNVVEWPYRLYVCSFSAAKESISQWQRYGGDGSGYCLCFDTEGLDELFAHDHALRFSMIYNRREQRAFLQQIIAYTTDVFRRGDAKLKRLETVPALASATETLDMATVRLKNPAFRDELEWRYVLRVDEYDALDRDFDEGHYVRGPYIKPFVALPRSSGPGKSLPLLEVICGPRLDPEIAIPSVKRVLGSRGYAVDVSASSFAKVWR